jgi:uncharacterized protein
METRYVDDREKLLAVRPVHRDYLGRLAKEGVVLAAGPNADDTGGIVLFDVADAAQLDQIVAEDPYVAEGVLAERTVREWNIVLGAWLPA